MWLPNGVVQAEIIRFHLKYQSKCIIPPQHISITVAVPLKNNVHKPDKNVHITHQDDSICTLPPACVQFFPPARLFPKQVAYSPSPIDKINARKVFYPRQSNADLSLIHQCLQIQAKIIVMMLESIQSIHFYPKNSA